MDRPEARKEWRKIFGDSVSFDDVYFGRISISDNQLKKLLQYSVEPREKELKNLYKEVWSKLRANEKIVVISAYYNGPGLVKTNTRFFVNLKKYTETGDSKYLKEAVIELGERSKKDPKLIPRRQLEARMLDSTKSPFYAKPGENITPASPLRVVLGKTRVPKGFEKLFPAVQSAEFFIWRTELDNNVRLDHLEREGVVYHKTMLPNIKEYNCRCKYVPVPSNLLIVDKNDKMVSFYSWIKYGGSSVFELK